jgi:hypothetical protein
LKSLIYSELIDRLMVKEYEEESQMLYIHPCIHGNTGGWV